MPQGRKKQIKKEEIIEDCKSDADKKTLSWKKFLQIWKKNLDMRFTYLVYLNSI